MAGSSTTIVDFLVESVSFFKGKHNKSFFLQKQDFFLIKLGFHDNLKAAHQIKAKNFINIILLSKVVSYYSPFIVWITQHQKIPIMLYAFKLRQGASIRANVGLSVSLSIEKNKKIKIL